MIRVMPFDNPTDFSTHRELVRLYEQNVPWPFAPVLHQVLTGVAGMWMYLALSESDDETPNLVGAGMLKSPEAVIPIGQDVKPLAWAISDMVTDTRFRRKGVGRALLRYMEGIAYSNGGRILYLYTDEKNEPACQLYRGCRFTRLKSQSGQAVFAKLMGAVDGSD